MAVLFFRITGGHGAFLEPLVRRVFDCYPVVDKDVYVLCVPIGYDLGHVTVMHLFLFPEALFPLSVN